MNIGIIGGSGFIGSHLIDKLGNHEVTVLDIVKPSRDVRYIYTDITDLTDLSDYDVVYMLAAMGDVNDVYRNPVKAGELNIVGVANVLEAARRSNVGRVILASTVWVYGMAEGEVNEDTLLLPSKHLYPATKIAAELYCHSYQSLYGQDFTILRYGVAYGPGASEVAVIVSFVKKALNGEPLTIQGDGSQSRNFIYVEDLVEGNVLALNDIAVNQTYNLEGMRPITIKDIAETVRDLIGGVSIEYTEARVGDLGKSVVSNDKAKRELGWEPRVDFEEGVKRYIEWYGSKHGSPVGCIR